ncbi:putative amidase domain protein [compost metagenome]
MFRRILVLVTSICFLFSLTGVVSAKEVEQSSKLEVLKSNLKQRTINYLIVPNPDKEIAREEGEVKFKKVINELEGYFRSTGQNVSSNLDDKDFQESILSLGGEVWSIPTEDPKQLIELIKFIDLYENYEINEKIDVLSAKLKSDTIQERELSELSSLAYLADHISTLEDSNQSYENNVTTFAAGSNGYDPTDARDYARTWVSNTATLRNNSQFGYYSNYYNCTNCWNDCTNFVSQALMAGGMTHYTWGGISDSDSWWYSNTGPSHSWGGAHNFYLHWRDRAGVAAYVSDLGVGDVINADFAGDGHIDHTAIITLSTGSSSSNKWLSQHTTDKKEVSTVADWFSSGYTVYGYEMDKSENYPY